MFQNRIGIVFLTVALVVLIALGAVAAEPKALLIKPEKPEFQVEIWTDRGKENAEYFVDEYVTLYFRTSDDAYVNIYSIMPDGKAELIFPNSFQRDNYVMAGETRTIPTSQYRLRVMGPAGVEYVQAVATKAPLSFPREWFGRDAGSVRQMIEKRLEVMGKRWSTDWASIRIREEKEQDGKIRVNSYQNDVKLYVDGTYVGTLPETVELSSGNHQLVAMKEGHRVEIRNLYIAGGEYESWQVRLEPLDLYRF